MTFQSFSAICSLPLDGHKDTFTSFLKNFTTPLDLHRLALVDKKCYELARMLFSELEGVPQQPLYHLLQDFYGTWREGDPKYDKETPLSEIERQIFLGNSLFGYSPHQNNPNLLNEIP